MSNKWIIPFKLPRGCLTEDDKSKKRKSNTEFQIAISDKECSENPRLQDTVLVIILTIPREDCSRCKRIYFVYTRPWAIFLLQVLYNFHLLLFYCFTVFLLLYCTSFTVFVTTLLFFLNCFRNYLAKLLAQFKLVTVTGLPYSLYNFDLIKLQFYCTLLLLHWQRPSTKLDQSLCWSQQ